MTVRRRWSSQWLAAAMPLLATSVFAQHQAEQTEDVGCLSLHPSADQVAPGMLQEGAEPEWKSRFDLGGTATFGTSDTQTLRLGVTSVRDRPDERTALDASYFTDFSDGDKTDNNATAGFVHDWLQPDSPWLYFVDGRFDYDQFKSWEYRLSGHVGVGYELVKKEDYTCTLRAGIGGSKEFKSDDQDIIPEALAGFDVVWKMSDSQSLTASSYIFPDLSDGGEFRTRSALDWVWKVDGSSNMSITAGLVHEYESDTDPGIDENDLNAYVGLGFDF